MLDGIVLPVIVAPMFLVSGPEVVIAAARAGVIGAFPTPNCRSAAEADAWMSRIVAETAGAPGSWAVNLVTHSSNERLADDLAVVAKHKPPLVITALGSPAPVIDTVHAYGGKVLADVISLKLARKAAAAGADGLVCVSAGAGGHTGFLSPFAFISALRAEFDGIICVGGGVGDGAAVAGAVAAGADYVYMGTRFIACEESMAVDPYKDMVVASALDDLLVSDSVSGTSASWLIPSLIAAGYDPSDMGAAPKRQYGGDPKRWKDVWAAGQGVGGVRSREPLAAIIRQLVPEYAAAAARLQNYPGRPGLAIAP